MNICLNGRINQTTKVYRTILLAQYTTQNGSNLYRMISPNDKKTLKGSNLYRTILLGQYTTQNGSNLYRMVSPNDKKTLKGSILYRAILSIEYTTPKGSNPPQHQSSINI